MKRDRRVAIIDTGGANLSSITYALSRIGICCEVTATRDRIRSSSHVILPGVGFAAESMNRVNGGNLKQLIRTLTQPVLGICLGMQLLFDSSDEGDVRCLEIIPGRVTRMASSAGLSIPHMGWNALNVMPSGSVLFQGIPPDACFYFAHSFVAPVTARTIATFQYGKEYPAVVTLNNFLGVQFHPERSGQFGKTLLENFLSL